MQPGANLCRGWLVIGRVTSWQRCQHPRSTIHSIEGACYEYHCPDQFSPADPGYPAPESAAERVDLGTAPLSRQPPLLDSSARLLLPCALLYLGYAVSSHQAGCISERF